MADIKRLNYFTSQFLVAKDFNDEQSYHLNMRRRLNRVLHTFGIADGLTVTRSSATQIQVGAGTAIDKNGEELVFQDVQTYTLVTAGNNLDVYLTIAYQEVFDPADHYTQSGLDTFNRTTERPLLHDGTAVPPTDGSVIVLARIHLGATGTIESDGSIDSSVRILAGGRIAPQAVGTTQLADGGITLAKLAAEAQPHPATAAQVDTQTGPNSIVTQINGGTGIIANARLERVMVTGTTSFANLQFNQEQFSDLIDPGFGGGPVRVELAFDDLTQTNITLAGDTGYARSILVRSEVDRTTGRFRVFAIRNVQGTTGGAHVRWFASRLQTATDTTVQVGVTVTPATVSLAGNVTQPFTATVTNATTTGVTWSITESGGGTLAVSGATATYTSPGLSGTYHVVATSVADTTKSATAVITVTAAIAVNISQTAANLITGTQVGLTASVINTTNLGINWTTTGGTLSAATGGSTTFTAPTTPGTYTVTATSAADNTKKASCTMTVAAVSISVSADQNPIPGTGSTVVRASISPAFADQNATWTLSGAGSLSTNRGPTTTYSAPGVGGVFTVTGTSVADTSKSQSIQITANNVGPSPSPSPSPGPGKFISESIAAEGIVSDDQAAQATADRTKGKARTFLAPQKRPKPTGNGPTGNGDKDA